MALGLGYYNKIPIYPIFYLLNPKSTPNHHLPHLNALRLKVGEHVGGRAWGGWEDVSWKFANEFSLATSFSLFLVSLQYLRLVYNEPPPQGPLPSTKSVNFRFTQPWILPALLLCDEYSGNKSPRIYTSQKNQIFLVGTRPRQSIG